ncbi:dephospho-CoA kinase [Jeotgalicoccus huakuii]|nr:dephospho-CoA kinase [Jeotgalicoccus huakuii]
MYKVIGLTGGIASGKTTVSNYLKDQGFTVLDADVYSRKTTEKNGPAIPEIIEEFGEDIVDESGNLNRKKLGNIIFNDEEKRKKLNVIVHPLIRQMMNSDEERFKEKGHVFLDIPLLFENGLDSRCDLIITVYVDRDVQIERLSERNNLSRSDAVSRIDSQMPLSDKASKSDIVFDNNGKLDELYEQVNKFLETLKTM